MDKKILNDIDLKLFNAMVEGVPDGINHYDDNSDSGELREIIENMLDYIEEARDIIKAELEGRSYEDIRAERDKETLETLDYLKSTGFIEE